MVSEGQRPVALYERRSVVGITRVRPPIVSTRGGSDTTLRPRLESGTWRLGLGFVTEAVTASLFGPSNENERRRETNGPLDREPMPANSNSVRTIVVEIGRDRLRHEAEVVAHGAVDGGVVSRTTPRAVTQEASGRINLLKRKIGFCRTRDTGSPIDYCGAHGLFAPPSQGWDSNPRSLDYKSSA